MLGQKRIPSREGGVEVVVEELATRMVKNGNNVTCYNRRGHHVSGKEYDARKIKEYKGIRIKTVPTINEATIPNSVKITAKTLILFPILSNITKSSYPFY